MIGKENVFSSEADRMSYSYDSAVLPPVMPSLVVRPLQGTARPVCEKTV